MRRILAWLPIVACIAVAACGPTLKNVEIKIEIPPGVVVAEGQRLVPVEINIANRETHVDTARGLSATLPAGALAGGM